LTDAHEPVAFWPLHLRSGGWTRPIGGPFSDWQAPIIRADVDLTPESLLAGAGLTGMTVIGFQPAAGARPGSGRTRVGANMTTLSAGFEAYAEAQRAAYPRHFKKMRRMMRNLERDFSEIEFDHGDTSDETFHWVMARKREQLRSTGRHDVLASRWSHAMFDRLRQREGREFRLRVSSLRCDGRLAAVEMNLQSGHVLHGWIVAFDPDFAYYSPGYILQHSILENMPRNGLTLYDAGPEHDHYKKYYANFSLPIESGTITGQKRVRPGAELWRLAERMPPARLSRQLGRVRRRADQICSAELGLPNRARAMLATLRHPPKTR